MTVEEAKRIIELFGPCTVVYECKTPDELIQMLELYAGDPEHAGTRAVAAMVKDLYEMESIHDDQFLSAQDWGDRTSNEKLQREIEERRLFRAALTERLKAGGFEVGS